MQHFLALTKVNIIYSFTQEIFVSVFYLLDSVHTNTVYQIMVQKK